MRFTILRLPPLVNATVLVRVLVAACIIGVIQPSLFFVIAADTTTTTTAKTSRDSYIHHKLNEKINQKRIVQASGTGSVVPCSICPLNSIITNSGAFIPKELFDDSSSTTEQSKCILVQIKAENGLLSTEQCTVLASSFEIQTICGCETPVAIATPTVFAPVTTATTAPVSAPVTTSTGTGSTNNSNNNSTTIIIPNISGQVTIQLQFVTSLMTPYIRTKYSEIVSYFFTKYLSSLSSSTSTSDGTSIQVSNITVTVLENKNAMSTSRRQQRRLDYFEYDSTSHSSFSSQNNVYTLFDNTNPINRHRYLQEGSNTVMTLFPLDTTINVSGVVDSTSTNSSTTTTLFNTLLRDVVNTYQNELVIALKEEEEKSSSSSSSTAVSFYFNYLNTTIARDINTPSGPIPTIPSSLLLVSSSSNSFMGVYLITIGSISLTTVIIMCF